jgi:hypothetical protein
MKITKEGKSSYMPITITLDMEADYFDLINILEVAILSRGYHLEKAKLFQKDLIEANER